MSTATHQSSSNSERLLEKAMVAASVRLSPVGLSRSLIGPVQTPPPTLRCRPNKRLKQIGIRLQAPLRGAGSLTPTA